jgi:hypothetical protein
MKSLVRYEFPDLKTRGTYQKILNRLPSKKAYFDIFDRYARIVHEDSNIAIKWKDIGTKKEIRIPAHFIQDSSFIQPTILLCEDEIDCKLYQKMAEVNLTWKKIKIKIRYEPRGGGGNRIANVYEAIQKNLNRFCLCIGDSDRKYPSGSLGDTAKNLKKIDKEKETLCECKIIEVREIENLIPTAMFNEVSNPERIRCIDFLEELEKSNIAEARKFIDLKEGLKGKEYYRLLSENQTFFNQIQYVEGIKISKNCKKYQSCMGSQSCTCILMYSLGDKILEAVISNLEEKSIPKISEMVSDALKPYWQEYGNLVVSWCCGTATMPS